MKVKPKPSGEKSHRDRFAELGKKIMTVPKSELVALEKKWASQKRQRKRP